MGNFVDSQMGGKLGGWIIPLDVSISGQLAVIDAATKETSGKFLDSDGTKEWPW